MGAFNFYRFVTLVLCTVLLSGCSSPETVTQEVSNPATRVSHIAEISELGLIPRPVSIKRSSGQFALTASTALYAHPEFSLAADYLIQTLASGARVDLAKSQNLKGSDYIEIVKSSDGGMALGEYTLSINNEGVRIVSDSGQGAFYGVQTLVQLMPPSVYSASSSVAEIALPNIEIADRPRFEWRGLMLDVSRHFFDKNVVKGLIDGMAIHKLNVLHLHLTDDPGWRIEIDGYPKLTEIGSRGDRSDPDSDVQAFFTKADLAEIVEYAAKHYITVVPEIDMPGHSQAAARAYPEFFDGYKTYNVANPESYEFIKNVWNAVFEVFPGEYAHFGADEVRDVRWDDLPGIQAFMAREGLENHKDIEAFFGKFVTDFLIDSGKTPVAWDEAVAHNVDKKTIMIWWRGRQPEERDHAVNAGYRVVVAPADHVYLDYAQAPGEPGAPWEGNDNGPNSLELIYNWDPVPDGYTPKQAAQIIGTQAAIWTEFIATERYLEFMTYPRLAAVAETAWSKPEDKDFDGFQKRIEKQILRYDALGLNYRIPGEWESPNAFEYQRN